MDNLIEIIKEQQKRIYALERQPAAIAQITFTLFDLFGIDNITPAQLSGGSDALYEYDIDGDIIPRASAAAHNSLFELDGNGDIMPKE